jgi:hypothetical protein
MATRRALHFDDFGAALADAERVAAGGCRGRGAWDAAQVCSHLADALDGAVSGFAMRTPWPMRLGLGRLIAACIVVRGRMPTGVKLPDRFVPPAGGDAVAALARLRASVDAFERHTGDFARHPLFGPLSRKTWRRLQLVHMAHHLSFFDPDFDREAAPVPAAA